MTKEERNRIDSIVAVKYFVNAFIAGAKCDTVSEIETMVQSLTPARLSKNPDILIDSQHSDVMIKHIQHIVYLIQHYVFDLGYKYEYGKTDDFNNCEYNDLFSRQLQFDIKLFKKLHANSGHILDLDSMILNHKPVRNEILKDIALFGYVFTTQFQKFSDVPIITHMVSLIRLNPHLNDMNGTLKPFLYKHIPIFINNEYYTKRHFIFKSTESIEDYFYKLKEVERRLELERERIVAK